MRTRGRSRIFFRRGCTRLLLYFNTNKPHSFFFFCRTNKKIPVVLENRRSSQGGGVHTPCTLPLDPPLGLLLARGLPYLPCKHSARDNSPTQVNFPPSCATSNRANLNSIIQFLSLIINLWISSSIHRQVRSQL